MKNYIKFLRSDNIVYLGFLLSGGLLAITVIIVAVFFNILPPFLPIYNKLPWGYMRVGAKTELFIPIVITVIIVIANSILAKFMSTKIILLSRMLAATSFAIVVA